MEPSFDVGKWFTIRDVINNYDAMGASVIPAQNYDNKFV